LVIAAENLPADAPAPALRGAQETIAMTTAQALADLRAEVASMREELATVSKPKASSVAAVVQPKAAFPIPKVLSCTAKPSCEYVARTQDGASHHLTAAEAAAGAKGHRIFRGGKRTFAKG
jgi:hypothetical protein